jgi:hypothetical protein
MKFTLALAALALFVSGPGASAQPSAPKAAPVRPPRMAYGAPITLAEAKAVAAAAEAAAIKAKVNVAIAVTDNAGELIYFEQLDDTWTTPPAASASWPCRRPASRPASVCPPAMSAT